MIRKTSWMDGDALLLANRSLEIVVPLGFGPRVMSAGRPGGPNLLLVITDESKPVSPAMPDYRLRGGHRLWHAPEHAVRTYQPDNAPVEVEGPKGRGVRVSATEERTGLRKSLAFEVRATSIRVEHTITNTGLFPAALAPWALTMLAPGGAGILPLPPKGTHADNLLPNYSLVPWAYTDFALPVWTFTPEAILVDTTRATTAQKVGITDYPGWLAYWRDGDLFVKRGEVVRGATYTDRGSVAEVFCNPDVIELETLAPFRDVEPGGTSTLVEDWGLLRGLPPPAEKGALRKAIAPAVRAWLRSL